MRSRLIYIVVVALAIATGVALRWPAMHAGLYTDDYSHHIMLEGKGPGARAPWNLYKLLSGDETEIQALKNFGTLGWWCHPRTRLAMFRPLSSLLIVFDHYILGTNTFAYHIHSLLWWVFMAGCLAVFLRSLLPLTVAAMAVVMFAVEEGNAMLFLWVANRCALVSLSCALLGLWLYIRWRNGKSTRDFWLSLICFTFALLGGEWTYPLFGYIFAFELFFKDEPPAKRFRASAPFLGLATAFAVTTRLLGFGSQYSAIYLSPTDDFPRFLYQGTFRFFALIADLGFGIPADWWHLGSPWRTSILSLGIISPPVWRIIPSWQLWHFLLGVTAAVFGVFLIRWLLRGCDPKKSVLIKWLLTGALIALLPMVLPFIASRSVVPACIGLSAVLAILLTEATRRLIDSVRRRNAAVAAVSTIVIVYVLAFQIGFPAWRTYNEVLISSAINNAVTLWVLNAEVNDKTIAKQDVVVINGVEGASTMFAPFVRHFYRRPVARTWRVLSGAARAHELTRVAPNAIDLHVLGGTMLDSDYERTCRSENDQVQPNETVHLDGLKIVIRSVRDGRPVVVRYIFAKSLDDPSYVFLESKGSRLRRFKLPRVGEHVRIRRGQMASMQPFTGLTNPRPNRP